jgi:hypothetical protein
MTSKTLKSAIWLTLVASAVALAAGPGPGGGGSPGGGGGGSGGGGPPVGGETSNNLAFPILELDASAGLTEAWSVPAGVIGTNYVYGCLKPEGDYLNTACLNGETPMAKDACATFCGVDVSEVYRIYKQKVSTQRWNSETIPYTAGGDAPVALIDWGDALESRTSSATSVVRVESMPFFDNAASALLTGWEMWHVSGTGIDEMWGARATDDASPVGSSYETPYAIMHTSNARLHLAKLSGPVTCPTTPTVYGSSPYDGSAPLDTPDDPDKVILNWDAAAGGWVTSPALPFQLDQAFSAELNIQGKYVYGYNWNLKRFDTGGVEKGGWWRLTFRASDLDFTDTTTVAVPIVPPAVPPVTIESETEGRLYVPVILPGADVTFIDVCIASAKGGGGNSRKPPSPGE